jgi:HEAT repeat protein
MKLRRTRAPDVPTLLEGADVEGLVEAASFRDIKRDFEGRATDRGAEVREQAILALGELGAEAGNGTVTAALRDPSDSVRSAAVRVLYTRQEVEPLAEALSWLPPTKGRARKLAFQALLELRSTPAARAVARALVRVPGDGPLSDADIAFLHTLIQPEKRRRPARGVVRELLHALADERSDVADRAEDALVRLAPTSTPGVIDELERGSSPERAAAVLGRIGDPAAMPPLIAALEHRLPYVRVQAAAALGALRDPAAVEPLLRATRDSELDVRAEASHALDRMGAAAVIVGMSALLGPMIKDAVTSAVERPALAEHGSAAPQPEPAAPQLSAPSTRRFTDALEHARANGGSPARL